MTLMPPTDPTAAPLLETIASETIADESVRQTISLLLNHIERLESEVNALRAENQRLRDENNRLKGEQGKPDIKPNRAKGSQSNHSSERERKKPQEHQKESKNEHLKIDREQVLKIPLEKLPADALFKGYEDVIVQDIKLTTDNVLFRKEKYYSPSRARLNSPTCPRAIRGSSAQA